MVGLVVVRPCRGRAVVYHDLVRVVSVVAHPAQPDAALFLQSVAMNDRERAEWSDEAERMRVLPVELQRQVVEIHLSTARDKRATRTDRRIARERASHFCKVRSLVGEGVASERSALFASRCQHVAE